MPLSLRSARCLSSFLFALAAGGAAHAGTPDCATTATTQVDINACAAGKYQQADAQLNRTYRQLLGREDGQAAAQLKEAQRRWVAWRDAQCAFEAGGVSGGSAQPMVLDQCLERLTRAQTSLLDSHLHCQEGDLACMN